MSQRAVRMKFCGITRLADAELAVSLGAWAIGMVFWQRSPRAVAPAAAAEIAAAVKRRVEIAGVFVNPALDEVAGVADGAGLTLIQLHGQEGPVFCGEVARRTGCKVIKAARVRSRAEIQALGSFHTDFHLFDSFVPGVPGGTGETFAWELARKRATKVPLILSGGLTPSNVAQAIGVVGPYAVDVASGVESAPGIKDPEQLRRFAEAVADQFAVSAS
ncbi:MAG: phosphoribosylanthranilate isomerase [Solirubrobacteraceae bacterium]